MFSHGGQTRDLYLACFVVTLVRGSVGWIFTGKGEVAHGGGHIGFHGQSNPQCIV